MQKLMTKKTENNILQIFTIWSDEIEGRIDSYFYISKNFVKS